jgi:hypothetical protein
MSIHICIYLSPMGTNQEPLDDEGEAMREGMYVCMYIYIYVCIWTYAHMNIHKYMCIFVYEHLSRTT